MKNVKRILAILFVLLFSCAVFAACQDLTDDEPKEFTYATDLVDGTVDKIAYSFKLSANYGNERCNLVVQFNGSEVTPDGDTYNVRLVEGVNEITVTAAYGILTHTRTFHVTLNPLSFLFECDAEQATIQPNGKMSFTANVTYGGEPCNVLVTWGGVVLTEKDGKYTFEPDVGTNEVTVSATYGAKSEQKTYNVLFRKDFAIDCDVEKVAIENDQVTFSAVTTFNDAPCNAIVKHNGQTITAGADGKYSVELAVGKNDFSVVARYGDFMSEKTYSVDYKGFTLTTTIGDLTTADDTIRFNLSVRYGDDLCEFQATADGATVGRQSQFVFILYMPTGGEYKLVFTATADNATYVKTITIKYVTDPPHFENISLVDGKQYKSEICCFDVEAKDALGNKVDNSALSFFVDVGQTGNYVELTKSDITMVWSDQVKTSYRFSFTNGAFENCFNKPLNFKIVVSSDRGKTEQVFAMTYVGADSDGKVGQVVFSLEGFTIGCGYFIEPTLIDIYKGENMAKALVRTLTEKGWTYKNTGSVESGFYLASIIGMDLDGNAIAPDLLEILKKKGPTIFDETIKRNKDGVYSLGEFDFTQGSGWMYSVNGNYPNYGFADHYPQDGEVIRVQFTLAYGSDLGGGSALGGGGANYDIDFGDYAQIHTALANIKANDYYGKGEEVYNQVIQAISVWNAEKKFINEQLAILKQAYGI